jgi:signal transduction histidine kinase
MNIQPQNSHSRAHTPLRVAAAFGLVLGFGLLLARVPAVRFQAAMAVALLLANGFALGAFLWRAWKQPRERLGWLLFALGVPLTLAANLILAINDPARTRAGTLDWAFLALSVAIGHTQAFALLAWPWRKTERASYLFDLLGSMLFSASLFLLLWTVGIWQAKFHPDGVIHVTTIALAGRLAVTSGAAIYLFSRDPRRIHGPLGWVLGALAMVAITVVLLHPSLPTGSIMDRATPWFAVVLLGPIFLIFAAISPLPVEAPVEPVPTGLLAAEAVLYIPFVVASGVLGLALFQDQTLLIWPLCVFLATTGLLVLRQFLLLREVNSAKTRLEERVAQRTRSLETLQSVILKTERMNAMATLGAGLAHDLNNLLGVIRNSAELMDLELAEGRLPETRDLNRIMEAASKAGGLSHRLMAFGRKESALASTRPAELREAVEATREILEMMLPRTIQLAFDLQEPEGSVPIDARALEQMLVNLVGNAKDAMPEGGTISVRLRGEAAEGGRRAILEVADTGPGVPPEIQDLIFEVFFTTKPEGKGTGLGLPSVRSLVEAQGGTVTLESLPGQGTTFRLAFPIQS